MSNSILELPVPTVNFHLWEPCNMRCQFCFATFQNMKTTILPKGHLPKEEAIRLVKEICSTGVSKITFAGGEPTLCPWLFDLIQLAKSYGKTTMIVTNGSRINEEWLEKYKAHLDWITLSIDSVDDQTNIESGRAIVGKRPITKKEYLDLAHLIKNSGIRFKVNTVVSAKNKNEYLKTTMRQLGPERWKIFQVLPIAGQNDNCIDDFVIDEREFNQFILNNSPLPGIKMIKESNDEMSNSYLMIDPAGRFYQNKEGRYNYSDPILDKGIKAALKQISIDKEKFIKRGGEYEWK